MAILEPGRFVFDAAKTVTSADWSPYDGMEFNVRIAGTFVRGKLVWDGNKVLAQPGDGRFLKPIL